MRLSWPAIFIIIIITAASECESYIFINVSFFFFFWKGRKRRSFEAANIKDVSTTMTRVKYDPSRHVWLFQAVRRYRSVKSIYRPPFPITPPIFNSRHSRIKCEQENPCLSRLKYNVASRINENESFSCCKFFFLSKSKERIARKINDPSIVRFLCYIYVSI